MADVQTSSCSLLYVPGPESRVDLALWKQVQGMCQAAEQQQSNKERARQRSLDSQKCEKLSTSGSQNKRRRVSFQLCALSYRPKMEWRIRALWPSRKSIQRIKDERKGKMPTATWQTCWKRRNTYYCVQRRWNKIKSTSNNCQIMKSSVSPL